MKIIVAIISALLCISSASGQENAVPKNVIKEFRQLFRSAEPPVWYVEPQYYEAQFMQDNKEKIAHFAKADGTLIQTKVLINEKEIPGEVIQVLRNHFPDFVLQDYSLIVIPEKEPFFQLNVKSGKDSYSLEVSSAGEMLSNSRAH